MEHFGQASVGPWQSIIFSVIYVALMPGPAATSTDGLEGVTRMLATKSAFHLNFCTPRSKSTTKNLFEDPSCSLGWKRVKYHPTLSTMRGTGGYVGLISTPSFLFKATRNFLSSPAANPFVTSTAPSMEWSRIVFTAWAIWSITFAT